MSVKTAVGKDREHGFSVAGLLSSGSSESASAEMRSSLASFVLTSCLWREKGRSGKGNKNVALGS